MTSLKCFFEKWLGLGIYRNVWGCFMCFGGVGYVWPYLKVLLEIMCDVLKAPEEQILDLESQANAFVNSNLVSKWDWVKTLFPPCALESLSSGNVPNRC